MSKPDFKVYVPVPGRKEGTFLKLAGVAWECNKNGRDYISVKLDLLPIKGWDGEIILFPHDDKPFSPDGEDAPF